MARTAPGTRRSTPSKADRGVSSVRAVLAGALLLALLLPGCHPKGESSVRKPRVGLSTSLPILWAESDDLRDLLASGAQRSWAADVLAEEGDLVPLGALADGRGQLPLSHDALLVLAQPRALAPAENVALDSWVRAGGRLLLFVDPALTQSSRYELGDPRRPQAMAMLSPILAHWGLELQFDPAEQPGERAVLLRDGSLPVNLPGRFRLMGISGDATSDRGNGGVGMPEGLAGKNGDEAPHCALEASAILADCRVDKGRVIAVADAAVLEDSDDSSGKGRLSMRQGALRALLLRLKSGD